MTGLAVADDVVLPAEVVTESIAILGRRGSGKSNTAVVLAEEMFAAGIPWVAIDPKGDWWGVRSDADGSGPGLPIPLFGGLHGDVPLDAGAGAVVADLIVDENLTAVLDVSDFSKGERARFLVAFFDRLYQRHRAEPQARHVFMEEAHEFIPQQMGREEGRLKDSASRIVLQGRSFGLGSSVCSQRSARIHKDVLTQTSVLFAMWTTGPQDRKAIEAWVHEHDAGAELVTSLPTLSPGEGWIWATPFDLMRRTKFRRRRSFDSGSTPVLGGSRKVATIADVDVDALQARMADTIERAKADDPKALRARIAELERQLAAAPTETVEVEVVREAVPAELARAIRECMREVEGYARSAIAELGPLGIALEEALDAAPTQTPTRTPPRPAAAPTSPKPQVRAHAPRDTAAADLSKAERSVLTVLAQYPDGRDKTQLALLTGYSSRGGGFNNALSSLRSAGYLDGANGARMRITDAGLDALGPFEPLPTGEALRAWWAGRLSKAERLIFEHLCSVWPAGLDKGELADATGYVATGGGFSNALSSLRTRELIEGYGPMKATDHLFQT